MWRFGGRPRSRSPWPVALGWPVVPAAGHPTYAVLGRAGREDVNVANGAAAKAAVGAEAAKREGDLVAVETAMSRRRHPRRCEGAATRNLGSVSARAVEVFQGAAGFGRIGIRAACRAAAKRAPGHQHPRMRPRVRNQLDSAPRLGRARPDDRRRRPLHPSHRVGDRHLGRGGLRGRTPGYERHAEHAHDHPPGADPHARRTRRGSRRFPTGVGSGTASDPAVSISTGI